MDKKKVKHPKRRESMTPEEQIARAQRARWRFRAIVRLVMQNIYWLDDVQDQTLGDDVHKNILLLTRKKEQKSLLSLQDKSILNKPAEYRTEAEKYHLSRIIGGLKCFRRYPNHVKSQLAAATYFFYFGPGRTIVRHGDESHSLYFIVTGEVTVSRETFDPVLNEMTKQKLATMGPGSMFGEVALLHEIPRTSTITSNTHIELLCLKKNDFDVILKSTVQMQWNAVKSAMGNFTYFEDWDEIAIRECCILSKMETFDPEATILGDGAGFPDFVYFIIKGKCRVVEHLLVTSEIRGNKKFYKLYETPSAVDVTSVDSKSEKLSAFSSDSRKTQLDRKSVLIELNEDGSVATKITGEVSTNTDNTNKISVKTSSSIITKKSEPLSILKKSTSTTSAKQSASTIGTVKRLISKPASRSSNINLPPYVQTHFMQVCLLNPTACFGIGENSSHRRVVAVSLTECLMIPRYWLMQKNRGNIWNRVQQFLNGHIPSTKQVFKAFVKQRRWMEYRKQVFNDILAKRTRHTNNSIANVPYYIRIHEQIDTE